MQVWEKDVGREDLGPGIRNAFPVLGKLQNSMHLQGVNRFSSQARPSGLMWRHRVKAKG